MKSRNEENLSVAEYIKRNYPSTKEEVLAYLETGRSRIVDKSKNDMHHSAAYYHRLLKLIEDFIGVVKNTVFLGRLEEYWFYSIYINYSGIKLALNHASITRENSRNTNNYTVDQQYILLTTKTKLLSVEQYAKAYDVETGTVRQWIRRGKIRSAVKNGNEWLIPELTEVPGRGYKSALYMWYEYLYDLPEEYSFLTDYTTVLINQSDVDKKKYIVTFTAGGVKPLVKEYDSKQREKLELFLISDPRIHNIESAIDEPQNVAFGIYDEVTQ